jgi:hypothetical protein
VLRFKQLHEHQSTTPWALACELARHEAAISRRLGVSQIRINERACLRYDHDMTRKKQPPTGREALVEEFNKLKNPQAVPLSELSREKTPKKKDRPQRRNRLDDLL